MTTPKHLEWRVLPHAPIQKLEDNLWFVRGTMPNMPIDRTMSIARMRDGRLVIYNAVALEEAAMKEIEAFGAPAFLVVPNGYHRIDCARFKHRYPEMKVMAPRGSEKKVHERVKTDLPLGDFEDDASVAMSHVDGTNGLESWMRVKHGDGRETVVLNDVVFNTPHKKGVKGFVLKHIMASSGGPRVSRLAGAFLIKDKKAFRAQIESLATGDLKRVVVAHDDLIEDKPADTLRAVVSGF